MKPEISIVVVSDNYAHRRDLKTVWGFACVVRGAGKTILFDTGGDGAVLMSNMRKLDIDPQTIDAVVLSHDHGDHTGGLKAFLAANPRVEVYAPRSFPTAFKAEVQATGARVIEVAGALEIADEAWSTGEAGSGIIEQSLALRGEAGLIVITGCAHPGIVPIVEWAKRLLKADGISLAMGGFHLRDASERGLRKIVNNLKELGVGRIAPSHCSGDRTRELFKKEYGRDFIQIGVGSALQLNQIL